jgi:excisionase family DNA binding protein
MVTTPSRRPSPANKLISTRRLRESDRPIHADRPPPLEVSPAVALPVRGTGSRRLASEVDAAAVLQPSVSVVDDQQTEVLLVTIDQAARRLSIGRSKLYELIRSGQIVTVHIDRIARIAVTDLADYVDRLRLQPNTPNKSSDARVYGYSRRSPGPPGTAPRSH